MIPGLSSLLSAQLIDRRHRHRRNVLAAFHGRLSESRLSCEKIRKLQDARLCSLLRQARDGVPFYRDLIPPEGEWSQSSVREVLAALPIVSREEIRQNADRFTSSNSPEVDSDSTSGSTGTPFQFRIDRATRIARESSLYWADSLAGWRYGDRCAYLWGNEREVQMLQSGGRMRTRAWLENRLYLSAYDVSADALLGYHRRLSRFRPHMLIGYASALEEFARMLGKIGVKPDYPRRAVVSSAEVLTPEARAEIESVFDTRVFNRYGSREFGSIAMEDSLHHGLVLNEQDLILEVESADSAAEPGRVIVTYLANTTMPFIRYDTGDVALLQAGSDVRRRIATVLGRHGEIIRTPGGRSVHANFFSKLFRVDHQVRRFQVIQEVDGALRILLERRGELRGLTESRWREEIAVCFGPSTGVVFEYVEKIHSLPSGKRQFLTRMAPG